MSEKYENLSGVIIDTLCLRRGFENWWLDLEDEDVEEIYEELEDAIKGFFNEECNSSN